MDIHKRLPISFLEMLGDASYEIEPSRFIVEDHENSIFRIVDSKSNGEFFFTLEEHGDGGAIYTYKPSSEVRISPATLKGNGEDMTRVFREWLSLIIFYEEYEGLFEDPILEAYRKEYEKQYRILDKDANKKPFSLEQQIALNECLGRVRSKFLHLKEGRTEEEQKELDNLVKETEDAQNNLTKETKRKIIQRMSKILAKAQKLSLEVIQQILVEVSADVVKKLLTGP